MMEVLCCFSEWDYARFPQKNWMKQPGRGKSGLPCLGCSPRNLTPAKAEEFGWMMDGWMEGIMLQLAKYSIWEGTYVRFSSPIKLSDKAKSLSFKLQMIQQQHP